MPLNFRGMKIFMDFAAFHNRAKTSCLAISITVIIFRSFTGNHECFVTKIVICHGTTNDTKVLCYTVAMYIFAGELLQFT